MIKSEYSNQAFIKLLTKWKKHLIIVVVIATILSVVFSGPHFIKPMYKSVGVVYPTNITPYSSETPTEQLLQLFKSADVREGIIQSFKLASHYKIDSTSKAFKTKLFKAYDENVSIEKTEYESINIEVWDRDPKIASAIADSVISMVNKKILSLSRKRVSEVVLITKNQMLSKKKELDSLDMCISEYRKKYDLLDYSLQVKEVSRANLRSNSMINGKKIDTLLKNLKYKGLDFIEMNDLAWSARDKYNTLKFEYENTLKDYNKVLTYTSVVTKPYPADKKSYPIRWLIVVVCAVVSFVLAMIIIMIIENYRDFFNNAEKKA